MIKNLARIDAFHLRAVPETAPAYCNDNRPRRRLAAAAKPAAGRRLASHWRTACGRLECYWQIEPADEILAEAPGPSCTGSMRCRLVVGRLGFAKLCAPAIRIAAA
jgi:hypothetical protein